MTSALKVDELNSGYGATQIVRQVSITVEESSVVVLLGANGAGKTTLLRTIAGALTPSAGSVAIGSTTLNRPKPEEVVRAGLVLVPEGRQLFGEMTVKENLLLGGYALKRSRTATAKALDRVFDIFPDLRSRTRQRCEHLSGGQQQMVAIGRGLMAEPRVLLLDEPSLGLAPLVVRELLAVLLELRAARTAILLVEQHAGLALAMADRAYVMERGEIVLEGEAAVLANDARVRDAYLGRAT